MQRSRAIPVGCRMNQRKWTLFYSSFGNCRMLSYKISACEVYVNWRKLIGAYKIHCKSPNRWPNSLTTIDWFMVHEATLSVCIRESAYVRCHVGCGRVQQTLFLHVSHIFQRCKKRCKSTRFWNYAKFDLPSPINSKTNRDLNQGILHPWPILLVLAWTGDELSCGQAHNRVNFYFEVKFHLGGQRQ